MAGGIAMSDDPPLTVTPPPSGKIEIVGSQPTTIMGEDDRWTLPPADQIAKMRRKALRELIRAYIEHAERGDAQNRRGGVELAIVRAQYLRDELARRSQDRQTGWIIWHDRRHHDHDRRYYGGDDRLGAESSRNVCGWS